MICKIISSLGFASRLLESLGERARHTDLLLNAIDIFLVDVGVFGANGDVILLQFNVPLVIIVVAFVLVFVFARRRKKDR